MSEIIKTASSLARVLGGMLGRIICNSPSNLQTRKSRERSGRGPGGRQRASNITLKC